MPGLFSLTFMLEVQDVSAFSQCSVSAGMPACCPPPNLGPKEPFPLLVALGMVFYYSSGKLLELAFAAFTETPLGLSMFGYPSTGCERGQRAGV